MGIAEQIHEVATRLLPALSRHGFKYAKSRRLFQRTTNYGGDTIEFLNSRFHLYLGFGVRHEAVHRLLSEWNLGWDQTTPTVVQNGLNVHPNRPIRYEGATFWEYSPIFDLTKVVKDASCFIDQIVLPWLERFGDPIKLREALANNDGWCISHRPWEVVVALDVLALNDQKARTYLANQKELAQTHKWSPDRAQQLAAFSEMIFSRIDNGA